MRTKPKTLKISIEVEIPVLVRISAYTRIRYGKYERVRSHYRRYYLS